MGGKTLSNENDAPQSTEPEETETNKASEHPSAPESTDMSTSEPPSSTLEIQQVSEAAPKEEDKNAEANLVDSENKGLEETQNIAQDAVPTGGEIYIHDKEIELQSQVEDSGNLELLKDDLSSASEPGHCDKASTIEEKSVQNNATTASDMSAKIEGELVSVPSSAITDGKEGVPKAWEGSTESGEVEPHSEVSKSEGLPASIESQPIKSISTVNEERSTSEPVNGKSEASMEPISARVESTSSVDRPTINAESKVDESAVESESALVDTLSSVGEPTVVEKSEPDEPVAETPLAPIESRTKSEEPVIAEDSKIDNSISVTIKSATRLKEDGSKHEETAPGPPASTLRVEGGRDEQPSVYVSEIEPKESHLTLAKENLSSDDAEKIVQPSPGHVENHQSPEEPSVVNVLGVESETERPIVMEVEHAPISDTSRQAEHEVLHGEAGQAQKIFSSHTNEGENGPSHDEDAQSPDPISLSNVESTNGPEISQPERSEPSEVEKTYQEDECKPAVVEDPGDIKAREEVARLNAKLMKVAMEEEAANQGAMEEVKSEIISKNEATDQSSNSPPDHEENQDNKSEPVSEQLPDPELEIFNHESARERPIRYHKPETAMEESPEHILGKASAEKSLGRLDSATDVGTPPQITVREAQNSYQRNNTTSVELTSSPEEAGLVSSKLTESTTLAVALGIAKEPDFSQRTESGATETPHSHAREDISDGKLEPKYSDAENEGPTHSTTLNRDEAHDSTTNYYQAAESHVKTSHNPSAGPLDAKSVTTNNHLQNKYSEVKPNEEDCDTFHTKEELNNSHFLGEKEHRGATPEPQLPSHPRTRALSSTDSGMDESREFTRAESPVTVLNSDDLFEDDEDNQVEETKAHEVKPIHNNGNHEEEAERGRFQAPVQIDEAANDQTWELSYSQHRSENGLDVSLNKQHHISQEIHRTDSSKFALLVDAVRSDLPIVSHLVKEQEAQEVGFPDGGHFSVEILDEYQEEDPEHNEEDHTEEHASLSLSEESEENYAEDARSSSPTLHIRTYTADTVPSFETYAQSDYSTPSTPDTAISPPRQNIHDEPTIRQSWMHQGVELQDHDSTEELKPTASPFQQSEFDPFNSQVYPSYVTPKSSLANLQSHEQESSESYNSLPESQNGSRQALGLAGSGSPSPAPAQRHPPLDTSRASPFSESQPYNSPQPFDSPISTTRSLRSNSPSHSLFPTDSTPPLPPSRSPRRPTFPSPSSLAKTPVSSPSIPSSSFFQKTRSLFESSSRQDTQSTPPLTRPRSIVFNSPSPPPKPSSLKSRPSSMNYGRAPISSAEDDELIVPRSLDGNGKPPSPAFTLPLGKMEGYGDRRRSVEKEDDYEPRERRSSSFLGGISKLGGLVGLEGSIHNPNRGGTENRPLLGDRSDVNGY